MASISQLKAFTQRLPKIELHAHLNGSIRTSTLRELAAIAGADPDGVLIKQGDARSLTEMFKVFDIIHKAVRGGESVRRIAKEMLEGAEADGVIYLEIRTTPRAHLECDLSKEAYVEAVLAGMQDYKDSAVEGRQCHSRLLLSIDRRDSSETADDTVSLAIAYQEAGVVGVDLSGDPTKGEWETWAPALARARASGLKIALHAGEVADTDDETRKMLDFSPDRFGHLCFLSESNKKLLYQQGTPVELCLTSNLVSCTRTIPDYGSHHFGIHHPHHPVALCTDDSAVFGTTLSHEYAMAMAAFNLDEQSTIALARQALGMSFLRPSSPTYRDIRKRLYASQPTTTT